MYPRARTMRQIAAEALSDPSGIVYGAVLGRVVAAWADWRVIEEWANGIVGPDGDPRAVIIRRPDGRSTLLALVAPPDPPAPFDAAAWE